MYIAKQYLLKMSYQANLPDPFSSHTFTAPLLSNSWKGASSHKMGLKFRAFEISKDIKIDSLQKLGNFADQVDLAIGGVTMGGYACSLQSRLVYNII